MIVKVSLFVAIVLLLALSHLFAASFGAKLKDPAETPRERANTLQWLCFFTFVPWAVALLLIAVVAA